MTRLNHEFQTVTLSTAPEAELLPLRRLLVLIPGGEEDLTALAGRLWEIANASGAHVQFLGLCSDPLQEPSLRRRLVTLSAMLNDGRLSAGVEIIPGRDWVRAVGSRLQAGDRLVCLAGQRAGLLQRPLSQILRSDLDVPLTILAGLAPPRQARSKWITQGIAWIGIIVILSGFFLLQAGMYQDGTRWTTLLMLGSMAVEIWLIWLWNSLF